MRHATDALHPAITLPPGTSIEDLARTLLEADAAAQLPEDPNEVLAAGREPLAGQELGAKIGVGPGAGESTSGCALRAVMSRGP